MNTTLGKLNYLSKQRGFTIVELLIVIVIIGILAALVIVAYNGITGRANDASIQEDLRGLGQKMELYNGEFGTYPTSGTFAGGTMGFKVSKLAYYNSYNLAFCVTTTTYAFVAQSKSGNRFSYSSIDGLKSFAPAMSGIVATCSSAGINTSDPTLYRDWGYNSGNSGAWYSYFAG